MSNISTLDKPLKFNRKREGGQQRAEQDSNRSQPISRNQDIEQVQELCKDFSTLPVQNIRELLNDLVHRKRLPVWDSKSTRFATVASADKKTLCRYLKMHLLLPVEEMDQVRELCSTLNKESVVNLRKMYTEIMPSTNVKASSLTKDKLCQTLSQALSTGQVHKISTFDRDNEYEKIIENDDAVDLPEWSKDAVSGELMIQPVVLANGQSYDRSTIVGCMKSANPKCPLTRKPITTFEPNVMLTQAIEEWLMKHFGVSLDILRTFRLQKEEGQRLKGVPAALQVRRLQEERQQQQMQIDQDVYAELQEQLNISQEQDAYGASLLQSQSDYSDEDYSDDE